MSDAVLAAIIGGAATIVAAVVGAVVALARSKRRKNERPPTHQPAATHPPASKIEMPKPLLFDLDAEGYPHYMRLADLPAGPRVLLPYATPMNVRREIRQVPPLSRDAFARDTFCGRWVRWTGIVRGIVEPASSAVSIVIVGSPSNDSNGYVGLMFPTNRRAEIEVLREGQGIIYEGQIQKANDTGLDLVRVEIMSVDHDSPTT